MNDASDTPENSDDERDLTLSTGMDVPRDDASGGGPSRILIGSGVVAVLAALAYFSMRPSPPTVERSSLVVSEVRRGDLVREVRGSGRLVPERVRFVSAVSGGRVERVQVRAGEEVGPETVLLELSNPDVRLQALQARQRVVRAESELVQLRRTLEEQRLDQKGEVEQTRADYRQARRKASDDSALASEGLIPRDEAENSADHAEALRVRLEARRQKLEMLRESVEEQIAVQRREVQRLDSVARYHGRRVEELTVRAGASGVVQGIDLEVGQWVQPGTRLAKVAQPDSLDAELRVPQARAGPVQAGQVVRLAILSDTVEGRVARVEPSVENGSVRVRVSLEGELPAGARGDQTVDGRIRIDRLEDAVHVERPAHAEARSTAGVFVLSEDGETAVRRRVRFGRASVDRIQVVEGLQPGDRVVVADMSRWRGESRLAIE